MAERFQFFSVVAPANTPKASPVTVSTRFNPGTVEQLEIVVPDGHAGDTGLQLAYAGQVVVPIDPTTFLVANDERIVWPVDGFLDGGVWSAVVFNTDVFDHTFFLRYLVNENAPPAQSVTPIVRPLAFG